MNVQEMYLDALKDMQGWVTVLEWASYFCEKYPDMLAKAEIEAQNQKQETTGLREIAARISSRLSRGSFSDFVEIDESDRPRRVKYIPIDQQSEHIQQDIDDDIAPLTRNQIMKRDFESLTTKEKYRLTELEAIRDLLRSYFKLDIEFEHAKALLNKEEPGRHHPDNVQLLQKSHNRMKNDKNWERFTIEEQIKYLESSIQIQKIVEKKMGVDLDEDVINGIIERLKLVY